eukprot:gene8960-2951_t
MQELSPKSAAARIGLNIGDQVVTYNDQRIESMHDLMEISGTSDVDVSFVWILQLFMIYDWWSSSRCRNGQPMVPPKEDKFQNGVHRFDELQ